MNASGDDVGGAARRSLFSKFMRYVVTGGAAAVVDLGGFMVMQHFGAKVALAAVASFLVAAVVNFSMSSLMAFDNKMTMSRLPMFLAFAVLGLVINSGVTIMAANWLDLFPALAKFIGIGVAFGFNFLFNAFVVFKSSEV